MSKVDITSQLQRPAEQNANDNAGLPGLPIGFVPTPTNEYRSHRKAKRALTNSGIANNSGLQAQSLPKPFPIPFPLPRPRPLLSGPRVLMYKQDPSVIEIGIRKAFLPLHVSDGPMDSRIVINGLAHVTANAFGDFIQTPGTDAFDAVHTFAVVRQTLTLYQRTVGTVPWQWNSAANNMPITVKPHAGVTQNAFYNRASKSLEFFYFPKPGAPAPAPNIYTCRSLDIVAHETGHAVLDGLKPGWLSSSVPQSGALHESFGDLTAIFLALSQFDQVEAFVAQTKANLHDKTFLSDMAEEFGLALGRPNGLRNADNDLKLSQVTNEVHDLSQIFTGAIYDILADIFQFEKSSAKDYAATLYSVAEYLRGLLLRAIQAAPAANATFADVANQMLNLANADGKPAQYRNFIRNRFTVREVVVQNAPLAANQVDDSPMKAMAHISTQPVGWDHEGCCGTIQNFVRQRAAEAESSPPDENEGSNGHKATKAKARA
ncbi:MAG: hypothetical protein M0P19_11405 [Nevskia sp.]|jgi:hypothetical protein|nr:hypothetical protein [Nevskia sp.]MCK9385650.1 hypothetical protein [Nevskia sp.]